MDALSDVLNTIHFKGTVYCHADFTAPWGLRFSAYVGHVGFLMVMRGGCLLQIEGQQASISMGAGDLVLSPIGVGYSIKDAPDSPVIDFSDAVTPQHKANKKLILGGGGSLSNLILGCFEFQTSAKTR